MPPLCPFFGHFFEMNMEKSRKPTHKQAQTMVEFALILPVLLLLVYGLLEVGRLIFLYTTVITAAREATRYGSATGLNEALTLARYIDCDGIRDSAENVDFLDAFDRVTGITIQYDHGPGLSPYATCPASGPLPNPSAILSGDRIRVTVSSTFTPIVPLVPLETIPINSTARRTLLVNVVIVP